MAAQVGGRSTGGDALSWREERIERDGILAIEYQPSITHGVVHEALPVTRRPEPPGVVFSQIVIVGGKVRLVEASECPNYHARNARAITAPMGLGVVARA